MFDVQQWFFVDNDAFFMMSVEGSFPKEEGSPSRNLSSGSHWSILSKRFAASGQVVEKRGPSCCHHCEVVDDEWSCVVRFCSARWSACELFWKRFEFPTMAFVDACTVKIHATMIASSSYYSSSSRVVVSGLLIVCKERPVRHMNNNSQNRPCWNSYSYVGTDA